MSSPAGSRVNRKRDLLLTLIWALFSLCTLPFLLGSWALPAALVTGAIFVRFMGAFLDRRKETSRPGQGS